MCTYLSHHLKHITLIKLGGWFAGIPAVAMLICFLMGNINPYTLFAISFFMFFSVSPVFAGGSALALAQVDDHSNASAVMFFINLVVSSIVAASVGILTLSIYLEHASRSKLSC